MNDHRPTVSVITATYNRSNVLVYAIRSLLRSTYRDWELLVIGDACTDDTGEVVASFADPRIRFLNLETNCGEQTGPNNAGFALAAGRYIAFLNHDDLWMPDHLEVAVNGIEDTGADLVFMLGLCIKQNTPNRLIRVPAHGRYVPSYFVPASCWLFRRELMETVGLWRMSHESYLVPSHDFLFRAWRAHKDLRLIPRMTVLTLPSGTRKDCYARREFLEQQHYFERMCTESDFRERELAQLVAGYIERSEDAGFRRHPIRALRRAANTALFRLGLHAGMVRNAWRYGGKGGLVNHLKRHVGLKGSKS